MSEIFSEIYLDGEKYLPIFAPKFCTKAVKNVETKRQKLIQLANIINKRYMTKKKPIKVHKGDAKKLAIMCGVSIKTVYNALHWNADTLNENKVRKCAMDYFAKQF